MIQSFADKETETLFNSGENRKFGKVSRVALRKLIQMNQARDLNDLAVPPGNQLKPLSGKLKGRYSIRVNEQWRIVFKWSDEGPEKVAMVDYH